MCPATAVADVPQTSEGARPAAPAVFYRLAGRVMRGCFGLAIVAGAAGLLLGLVIAPADGEQQDLARVVFIHAPVAWLSLFIYFALAVSAALGLFVDSKLPAMLAHALAPSGAVAAFLALWTGSLWGKPGSSGWWTWDARLTSELLLLALVLGFIVLRATLADRRRAEHLSAWLALAGLALLPAVYLALLWGNSAQVGAAVSLPLVSALAGSGLAALMLMLLALAAWVAGIVLHRMRSAILETGHGSDWVLRLPEVQR